MARGPGPRYRSDPARAAVQRRRRLRDAGERRELYRADVGGGRAKALLYQSIGTAGRSRDDGDVAPPRQGLATAGRLCAAAPRRGGGCGTPWTCCGREAPGAASPADDVDVLCAAGEKAAAAMAVWPRTASTWGLLHMDLLPANIVYVDGRAGPIDFGASGWGYLLNDLAATFCFVTPQARRQYIDWYGAGSPPARRPCGADRGAVRGHTTDLYDSFSGAARRVGLAAGAGATAGRPRVPPLSRRRGLFVLGHAVLGVSAGPAFAHRALR